jgi:hypothetical protein
MAPGNLNLKKSWHPGLLKNQKKVWEAEQEALAERRKIQERQEEIAKERELTGLRALQYAQTGKKIQDRVEWMYENPSMGDGRKMDFTESEDYLLGKKRVDQLIVKAKVEEKKQGFEKLQQGPQLSQQQEMDLFRHDPIMKIRQQQMKKLKEKRREKNEKHRSNGDGSQSGNDRSDRGHKGDRARSDRENHDSRGNYGSHKDEGGHRSHRNHDDRARTHRSGDYRRDHSGDRNCEIYKSSDHCDRSRDNRRERDTGSSNKGGTYRDRD